MMLCGVLAIVLFAALSVQDNFTTIKKPHDTVDPKDVTYVVDKFSAPLQFREDGTFQLSILEDLHFGESECFRLFPVRGGL